MEPCPSFPPLNIIPNNQNTINSQIDNKQTHSPAPENSNNPNINFEIDMKHATMGDFDRIRELGVGNGGVVSLVRHRQTKKVVAQKLVRLEVKKEIMKRITTELKLLEECNHENIVKYYGNFTPSQQQEIVICMEHMDGRSLDVVLKTSGRFSQRIIGVIAICVLRGLRYLHEEKKVMHRDIKPSNILVNTEGKVKLCDFGVSANLINSIANSFVGTRSYMAPERLMGTQEYTIKSDVWALGITLIELALGFYPIPGKSRAEIQNFLKIPILDAETEEYFNITYKKIHDYAEQHYTGLQPTQNMAIFELLDHIVTADPPQLYEEPPHFDANFVNFVNSCLKKEMQERATFIELSEMEFVKESETVFAKDTEYFSKYMTYIVKKYSGK